MIKTISLFMKHNDCSVIQAKNDKSELIIESNGYMPDIHMLGGDTTELHIDNETGKIIGWVPFTEKDFLNAKDE